MKIKGIEERIVTVDIDIINLLFGLADYFDIEAPVRYKITGMKDSYDRYWKEEFSVDNELIRLVEMQIIYYDNEDIPTGKVITDELSLKVYKTILDLYEDRKKKQML